jgi:DNA-binding CsgD family transcriptional regulator
VTEAASSRPRASDRATVERTVRDLILGVVEQRVPAGTSIVLEGVPGIGKTFLARTIVEAIEPGTASIRRVAGLPGRRNDPFGVAGALLGDGPGDPDPGDAAFDRVDELCADGPVVLWVDDAHHLDAASLTLLRRLAWASRDLPLVLLVSTRPYPSREPLAMLVQQAQVHLRLPPMGPMMTERLVYDHTGRWPGPVLRRVLDLAAVNPLFATELLGTYERAGALAEAGPDSVDARFELDLRATGLDEVVRAHLGQLDQPTRDMLAVMSVWGTGISAEDLARLLPGQPGDGQAPPPDDLLERAIASGLIRREPAGTVGFSHDLFREVTYAGLAEPRRRALHRQVAGLLAAAGYRPTLVADHLLRAAGPGGDPALAAALHEAVTATRGYAPEVTADLLGDVAALGGAEVTGRLLLDRADALFHRGRGESAEALIRERIATVTDPGVAAQMQLLLIRSLMNRADIPAALAALDRTIAIPALPDATRRQLEGSRAFLLAQAGRPPDAAEQDAMMARFAAAGDQDAQANLLATFAVSAFLAPDVTRIALARMDRQLAGRIGDDVPALCPPEVSRLVLAVLAADPDAIESAAAELAGAGRLAAESFAREELACAAAAGGDRARAVAAREAALAGYRRMGAVPDRDRALARMRALGVRRGSREAHRDTDHGWASLTAAEIRIAALVREGLTNREIGTRLFVSPRTVQVHVSHILQKTGLRSRVEIASSAIA